MTDMTDVKPGTAPRILKVETGYQGWAKYLVLTLKLADGEEIRREVEDHGTAVALLPYDADRKVALLVRQLRPPAFYAAGLMELLEAPAGGVSSADPAECARREAMEECGVALTRLEHVAKVWSMPGVSTERMDLFLAPYGAADRVASGGGVAGEHENITVVEMPLAELERLMAEGGIEDMKTLVLVQALRLRHPGLFGGE